MNHTAHRDSAAFRPVTLEELDRVSFLCRKDTKYVLREEKLKDVLSAMQEQYSILEIDGIREFHYTSQYMDTPDFFMYLEHHNKRLNRFKLRRRVYEESGLTFWEVKFKNNRGITIKNRMRIAREDQPDDKVFSFVTKFSPFTFGHLEPKLISRFSRMTFVNNDFTERVTIDRQLSWTTENGQLFLNRMAIIEIKNEKKASLAQLFPVLRNNGVHQGSFSKYTFGCALMYSELKQNLLKNKLNQLKPFCHVSDD